MRAKILNASAGSGKTYQLAYKYVRDVVEQPSIYRHILAVTFTNKATEEMKSRILKEIHLLASGGESSYLENLCRELDMDAATVRRRAAEVRSKILHDYSRFTVLTIDTFFQRILRAFIKELGIDLNYNVEIETASVLTKSADTLIEQITTDRDLQRWLTDFVQERIDEGKKWDVRDGILTLGGELFKEKNKEALSFARSREELGRIVGEATARAATKQQMRERAAEAVRIMADAGVGPADFTGKSRSFAHYFLTVAAGELKPYTATVGKMSLTTEGWGAQGIARRAARRPAATPAARNVRSVRRQRPLVEHLRPAARELPQLRAAVGPLRQGAAVVRRAEHDAPLGDQIHPLGIHRPQRRAVHLREGRQPLRTLHDRRISGHLRQGVGELPAPAAKRHVAERGDLGADRGRHQAVDLPLAGRRLENPPLAGTGAARPGQHRGGDTQGELPQPARRGGVQQRDHRSRGRDRQPGAERDARRSGRKGRHRPAAAAALHDTLRDAYRGHAQTPAAGATGRATSRSRPSPSSRPSWSASARCWTRDSGRATS